MAGSGDADRTDAARARCRIDVDTQGKYGWRMIAQNGRVVAVSAQVFDEPGDCGRAFEELRERHGEQTGAVQHTPSGNGWVWLLRKPDGDVTAVSGRAYERHSTCRAAYDRFRSLLSEMGGLTGSCL